MRYAAVVAMSMALLTILLAACAATAPRNAASPDAVSGPAASDPIRVADGVLSFSGAFASGRQPDGNSVVIDAPEGLIVFDTGRHREHTQRLLDHARAVRRPVVAIVNSHWHLDHSSGNRLLRAAYPRAEVIGSRAVEGALGGFLADSRKQAEALIAQNAIPEPQLSDVRGDIATIAEARSLLPTVPVEDADDRFVAGRHVFLGLTRHAATAGDVWLIDPATRVLLAGDLVTLPAPLFDTACPQGWREALAQLDRTGFVRLVPGHGAPMDRAGFDRYRSAFGRLLECADGDARVETCGEGWLKDAGDLVPEGQRALARSLLDYYVGQVLRGPARGKHCPA